MIKTVFLAIKAIAVIALGCVMIGLAAGFSLGSLHWGFMFAMGLFK